jgi:hypothetical protein
LQDLLIFKVWVRVGDRPYNSLFFPTAAFDLSPRLHRVVGKALQSQVIDMLRWHIREAGTSSIVERL